MGQGGNTSGLVWVMNKTSVLVIILHISKKEKNKTKQPNTIQENKEEEPRNKRSQTK